MERDEISEFLKKMGMKDNQQPEAGQWDQIIQPNSSYIIFGDVGTGKSALAYWLLENYGRKYNLQPVVVGLPPDKLALLPSDFMSLKEPSECIRHEHTITFIDEADIQLPIEDTKAREYVINFLSLPRHRKHIFILAFHFPRLVLGRYLPFFAAFLHKRPPYLLEFASKGKGDALMVMMQRAEERFGELPSVADVVKYTYVVAPRIRWQGLIENPLPSFWSQDLSEIWSGTDIQKEPKKQLSLIDEAEAILAGKRERTKGWLADDPEKKTDQPVTLGMMRQAQVVEEHPFENSVYVIMEAENESHQRIRWVKQVV